MAMNLEIITPERSLPVGQVESVTAPGVLGEFCVLPGHRPMLSALDIGEVSAIDASGKKFRFVIGGGFADVNGERTLLLVDTCLAPSEVDLPRAEIARRNAEAALAGKAATDPEYVDARDALRRAEARIKAARSA